MYNIFLMREKRQSSSVLANLNESNWMDFHASLIEKRIEMGLTQAEVASMMGTSQPAISQFESLSSYPNVFTLLNYALAIGAQIDLQLAQADS